MGEETELDRKDDLVMIGYVESQNRGSAAPLHIRRVRNLDQNGLSREFVFLSGVFPRILSSWGLGLFNRRIPDQQKSLQATIPRLPSTGQTAHNLARASPLTSVLVISSSVY